MQTGKKIRKIRLKEPLQNQVSLSDTSAANSPLPEVM